MIAAKYHDSERLGTLVEQLIDVFGGGVEKRLLMYRDHIDQSLHRTDPAE